MKIPLQGKIDIINLEKAINQANDLIDKLKIAKKIINDLSTTMQEIDYSLTVTDAQADEESEQCAFCQRL